jgi:hypothetical protein
MRSVRPYPVALFALLLAPMGLATPAPAQTPVPYYDVRVVQRPPAPVYMVQQRVVAAQHTAPVQAPTLAPQLGSFYPDRYVFVAGNNEPGMGHSPLGMYGPNNLVMDGPLSAWRSKAAPVASYSRGYDGVLHPSVGTGFSYPNRPDLAPIVYPTRGNVASGFRQSGVPPQWLDSINWIDQN